jgi:hypothetical protein
VSDLAGDFPDPNDFPDYDTVDSRTILDPEDSFDPLTADFKSENGEDA